MEITDLYLKMQENHNTVMQKFNDGEKRFDKQDIALGDIKDQIEGNPAKDIHGIKPMLKEHQKILVLPIFITKLPKWAKIAFGIAVIDIIGDINSVGLISFIKFLLKL